MVEQPATTLPDALRFWARATPSAIALRDGDDAYSYAELHDTAESLAGRLAHTGVRPGDRVALVAENRAEWVLAFLACLGSGALVVPMNVRLGAAELGRQLQIAAPRLALVSGTHEDLMARAAPNLARRRLEHGARGAIWREPALAGGFAAPAPTAAGLVSFTSGTTGSPKGAVIAHGSLATSAAIYARLLGTTSDTTTLVLVPLFHNTGFLDQLAQMLVVGGTVDLLREFHVADAIDALARRPASYLIGVPSIFRLMMLDPRADDAFGGVRILAYGGAPMPPAWIEELAARWPALRPFNIYGLTEFTSLSHALEPAFAVARAGTVGRPVEQMRQRVVADDGGDAPFGQPGEVWLAGPTRMQGYLANEAATADVFRGPWLRTGDLGAIDDDGFLTLHGRSTEVIVRGGEKIHASQVESELGSLEGVAEAAVVGLPDDVLQERVVACVVERPGHTFVAEQARAGLRERIADYAVPDRFLVVDALPRNANGKIDRAQVRAAFEEAAR